MAPKATKMDDLDLPTVDSGDGESTVDPRSEHGEAPRPDGKSSIDVSEYIGPDPAETRSGGFAVEPTSASGKVEPEFQSVDAEKDGTSSKPKAARRGRPARQTSEESKGDGSSDE